MTKLATYFRVKKLLSVEFFLLELDILPQSVLKDLRIGPDRMLDLINSLKKEFKIQILEEEAAEVSTVLQVTELVEEKLLEAELKSKGIPSSSYKYRYEKALFQLKKSWFRIEAYYFYS